MFQISTRRLLEAGALLGLSLFAQPAAYATLVGDAVSGSLTTLETITTPFASPAVVGAGPEFHGVVTDQAGQVWDIVVDISASSFTVAFTEAGIVLGPGNGNLFGAGLLEISLSDLDWVGMPSFISGVVNSDYSCSSPGISCTAVDEGPFVSALAFTPDSVSMIFDAMRHGDSYTFDVAVQQVAEPAVVGLLSLALVGLALLVQRRNHDAST